jgi:hypothetical protein
MTVTAPRYKVQSEQPEFDHRIVQGGGADLIDDLGRTEIARVIASEVRGPERPDILGVYGSWGSGKSYLIDLTMHLLRDLNRGSKLHVLACLFEPWKYEFEGDLTAGLVKSLSCIEEFNPHLKNTEKYKAAASTLLETLLDVVPSSAAALGLPAVALGKAVGAAIHSVTADAAPEATLRLRSQTNDIRQKMQSLVDTIFESAYDADSTRTYRLVVFIDDLDRCSPENMVHLFEWLKIHLDVAGCTYVLALDHVAAARAIVGEYKKYLAEEHDLAYGFRYLEKLVDREYEISLAPRAELMALRSVYGRNCGYERLSDAARVLSGGDFPGVRSMDDVLNLRALGAPRTMLKIVYRFKRCLEAVLSPGAADLRKRLPAAYPYWMLLLIAMYYRFHPDMLDEFTRGRGAIYQLMSSPGSVVSEKWGDEPLREFCWYADRFGASAGSSMQLPPLQTLAWLATIVRECSFDPTTPVG